MKFMYAPWRSSYAHDASDCKTEKCESEGCVFCQQLQAHEDEKYHIIKRFEHCALIMNKFPYNAGHCLIVPLVHVGKLDALSIEIRSNLMEALTISTETIQQTLRSEGMNIGINLGKAAGAGIPAHLHIHLLPRWLSDTNFMPTIGNTKVISFDLDDIYKKLVKAFNV